MKDKVTKSTHTPGPWHIAEHGTIMIRCSGNGLR